MTLGVAKPSSLQYLSHAHKESMNMADKSKMDDLGRGRRLWLASEDVDYQRQYQHYGNVGTSQLEATRAINRNAGQANADRTALSAWSSKLITHKTPTLLRQILIGNRPPKHSRRS